MAGALADGMEAADAEEAKRDEGRSQAGQDAWVLEKAGAGGYFVEAGAHDELMQAGRHAAPGDAPGAGSYWRLVERQAVEA